jgi:hypothetical protein
MNAQTKLTPAIPADPKHLAKSLVRSLPLTKCAEFLVALVEEMDSELQNGWLTEDRDIAEGSLEGAAALDAADEFRSYIETLIHPDDGSFGPTDEQEHSLSFAQLGLRA